MQQPLSWIKEKNPQNDLLPSPRDGHTLSYIPELGCLILFGGFQCNEKANEVFLYDIEKNVWKLQPTVGKQPSTRAYHCAFYEDSYFFVYGGQGDNNKVLGDINFLNVITWEWKSLWVLEAPPARKFTTISDMANQEKEKILFGGAASTDNNKLLGDIWIISYNNVSFNSINQKIVGTVCTSKRPKGDIPEARAGHSAAVHNKALMIWGGKTNSAEDANCIYQLLFETWTWKKIAGASKSVNPRAFASSCQFEADSLLIFGGLDNQSGKLLNDTILLNLEEFKWSDPFVSGHLPMPRYNHAACVYETTQKEKAMAVLGGLETSHCSMGLFRLVEKGGSAPSASENSSAAASHKNQANIESTLSAQKATISDLEKIISREKENNLALEDQINTLEEELSALQGGHRSKIRNFTEKIENLDNEYFVNYDFTKNLFSLIPIEQLILTEININNSMLEEVIQKSESYLIGLDKLFLAISKYKFDDGDQHEVRLRDLFESSQNEVLKLREQHRESLYYMKNTYDDYSSLIKRVDNDINRLRQQILEIDENYREILIQSETEEL